MTFSKQVVYLCAVLLDSLLDLLCVHVTASGGDADPSIRTNVPSCVVRVCVCPPQQRVPAMKHEFSRVIAFNPDAMKEMSTLSGLRLVLNIIISADPSQTKTKVFTFIIITVSFFPHLHKQKPLIGSVASLQ